MKYVKTLLLFALILTIGNLKAQNLQSRILKLGYASDFMPLQNNGHYSINIDLESSTRNNFISSEFGAGYMHNGSDLYYTKFDYKFYPISAILNNFRYQLLYLSLGPGLYYEDLENRENRFGLGVFTTAGVQFLLNNRLSMAFEVEANFISSVSGQIENNSKYKPQSRHFSNSIKIGYIFNKRNR